MKDKTILHSDVNNFFASVECATNLNLKNKPVAVTGNPEKRNGIILAKNDLAKKSGVQTGQAIWQAKQKCPDLVTVGPHYALYEKISKRLHALYLDYTDFVEPLGLDECWLDVTGSLKFLNKTGEEIADEIREKVKKEFGFTVSVGVSFSKIFAKLGSDMKKPDATTVIDRLHFKELTYPLSLDTMVGFGKKLSVKFSKMNINTIGEFVALNESFVKDIMGKTGVELHQKLSGKFDDKVACYFDLAPPKSVGNGTTTIQDIESKEDLQKVLAFLAEKVGTRLTKAHLQGRTVTVTLKTNEFEKLRHSKTISPIQSSEDILKQTTKLVDDFFDYNKRIRAVRVRVSNLVKTDKIKQLSLFTDETDRLEETITKINKKYGKNKIFIASDTASFINRKNEDEELAHDDS